MLDYAANHSVKPMIELISIDQVNEAYERFLRSDVGYGHVYIIITFK